MVHRSQFDSEPQTSRFVAIFDEVSRTMRSLKDRGEFLTILICASSCDELVKWMTVFSLVNDVQRSFGGCAVYFELSVRASDAKISRSKFEESSQMYGKGGFLS
jgi:hypothetical protein